MQSATNRGHLLHRRSALITVKQACSSTLVHLGECVLLVVYLVALRGTCVSIAAVLASCYVHGNNSVTVLWHRDLVRGAYCS